MTSRRNTNLVDLCTSHKNHGCTVGQAAVMVTTVLIETGILGQLVIKKTHEATVTNIRTGDVV
jgi:hypothetical protein